MRDIILVGAVLIAALVGFRRPVFGMLTFAFLGFFNPHSFTWSFARSFPMSQLVAISTMFGLVVSPERKKFPLERETILLVGLWLAFALSSLLALYPDEALKKLQQVSKIMLMIAVATMLINTESRLQWLIRVIGFSIGFYGIKGGLYSLLNGFGQIVYGPEPSFLSSNNAIGLAMAMNVPILLYLIKREEAPWVRNMFKVMLVLSYPAVIGTSSRGAWLGLATVTMFSFVKSRRKLVIAVAGLVLGGILLLIGPQLVSNSRVGNRYDRLMNYDKDDSAQQRFWNWELCKRVGMSRPLTGGGFDFYKRPTVAEVYPEYLERWRGMIWSCHSSWLTIFGEHGMLGSILWISLFAGCFMSLRQIRAYGKANPDRAYFKDLANMVQISLIAYFVVGSFVDAAYFDMTYYIIMIPVMVKTVIQTVPVPAVASPAPALIAAAFYRSSQPAK